MAGPWVSIMMAMLADVWRATSRMRGTTVRTHSWVPWLMFNRKTLAPAAMRRASTSGESVAGPRVQIILVLRMGKERRVGGEWQEELAVR